MSVRNMIGAASMLVGLALIPLALFLEKGATLALIIFAGAIFAFGAIIFVPDDVKALASLIEKFAPKFGGGGANDAPQDRS